MTTELPSTVRSERSRGTWLDFATVVLLLVGFFNVVDGISALADSSYLANNVLFANLHAWGWFFLIVGVVQIGAGVGLVRGVGWAAIVGMITAFGNAIAQLAASHTFAVWSITVVVLDVLVIYGLVRYGGDRGRPA